jgi:hypothetical protein
MVDLLLRLLEKLGELANYRSDRKKREFKEMAELMFNELLEVHKDYIAIFAKAQSLADQRSDVQQAQVGSFTTPKCHDSS